MAAWQRAVATRRGLIFLYGAVPVLATAVLALSRPALLAHFDNRVQDTLLRSAPLNPRGDRVLIVDVDERSLATFGQWPWRRDLIARLIGRLRDWGASVVALDIIFAEADRFGPADSHVAERVDTTGTARSDDVLSATLASGRVVLGYAMTFDTSGAPNGACVLHPIGVAMVQSDEDAEHMPFFRATGAVCTLPALARAAGVSGFLNAAPDADGILRRVPLLIDLDGRTYPALALAAVVAATGARNIALRVSNVNASSLIVDRHIVPLDGKSNLLVRYRGKKRTFPYVSAADVLNARVNGDAIRDKIVFIGTTALGTREVVATPLDTLFTGVEVQATVADNLLQQDFVERPAVATIVEIILVLMLGLSVAGFGAVSGLTAGVLAAACGIVVLWFGSIWSLSAMGVVLSPLAPTIGQVGALAMMTLAKAAVERRRADRAGREKTTAQKLMVQSLLSLTETRDVETGRHSRRTQEYARLLAEQLAMHPEFSAYLTPERIELLSSLAPLHDIGKVGVPDHILNKPGALTGDELAEMQRHPSLGRDVILKAQAQVGVHDDTILEMAKDIVYTHHERFDGKGYPQGLRGTEIPIAGRVMAIVDVYDAAVTRTLYRPSISHDDAVRFIVNGRGTHFDPAVVDAFVLVAPVLQQVAQSADTAGVARSQPQ